MWLWNLEIHVVVKITVHCIGTLTKSVYMYKYCDYAQSGQDIKNTLVDLKNILENKMRTKINLSQSHITDIRKRLRN